MSDLRSATFQNAKFLSCIKKKRKQKHDHHPQTSHSDVFTLTCCWGSGTSPPFWSWGHPQSWPRSHTEPRTGSLLQGKQRQGVRMSWFLSSYSFCISLSLMFVGFVVSTTKNKAARKPCWVVLLDTTPSSFSWTRSPSDLKSLQQDRGGWSNLSDVIWKRPWSPSLC